MLGKQAAAERSAIDYRRGERADGKGGFEPGRVFPGQAYGIVR